MGQADEEARKGSGNEGSSMSSATMTAMRAVRNDCADGHVTRCRLPLHACIVQAPAALFPTMTDDTLAAR